LNREINAVITKYLNIKVFYFLINMKFFAIGYVYQLLDYVIRMVVSILPEVLLSTLLEYNITSQYRKAFHLGLLIPLIASFNHYIEHWIID